jgi:hypothetical protein
MASFGWLLILSAVLVTVAWVMAYRLTPSRRWRQTVRWLLFWSLKGVLLPLTIWALMNVGLSWNLQPFMPEVQVAQNSGGDWLPDFLRVVGIGLFIIASYWSAGTLGWTLAGVAAAMEEEARKDFKALCWTCCLAMIIPSLIILALGGWPTLGLAAAAILVPLAWYTPGLLSPKNVAPIYARAIARIKFGKYSEAEWEIIHELEKCEDDFEGWMMLAELYASHFQDLAEAEQTIRGICEQPSVTPTQLSVALHKLADWQLKLGGDPAGARRALKVICDRLRGSHLAFMAQLRMNQLPATAADLHEQQAAKPIPLPALGDSLDEPPPPEAGWAQEEAVAAANGCVGTLKQNPNNVPARESLARLFAERLNQADQGIAQIMLLLGMPNQPESKRAEWLSMIAAWHLKYRHDVEEGRAFLQRILNEHPQSPQAIAAQRRMHVLDAEAKRRDA